jgi:hypothetical protein
MARRRAAGLLVIERLRLAFERVGLQAWFVAIDLLWFAKPDVLAIDARHYQRAASAWLAGGDPFAVMEGQVAYVAGPHTLLFYAPTSVLPLTLATWAWMVAGLVAAVWVIRRLGLPIWWLLFPPLAHAIWNGNPQTISLALLLAGGSIAASVAVLLKLYTGLALAFRWRDAVIAAVVLVATLPFVPWQLYLDHSATISEHLASSWNGSAWRFPLLVPFVVLAIWIVRTEGGAWYAVGALWPGTQFYYVSMALPAIVKRPLICAALALPVPLMTPVIVMLLAARHLVLVRRRPGADSSPSVAASPSPP